MRIKQEYKDRNMTTVSVQEYELSDYTEMLKHDIMRIITDVENLVYTMNGNARKSDWPSEQLKMFEAIRHKLLDKAGDVGRIPDNLIDDEDEPLRIDVGEILRETFQ